MNPKVQHAISVLESSGATLVRTPEAIVVVLRRDERPHAVGEGLVDVAAAVDGTRDDGASRARRRTVHRAARGGEIAGACRVGRSWLAPAASVAAWVAAKVPTRSSASAADDADDQDDDELGPLRDALGAMGTR